MARFAMPDDSPLHDVYPDGFEGANESDSLLNAVYRTGPAWYPDILGPTDDPGAESIVPDRDTYYEDPNAGETFSARAGRAAVKVMEDADIIGGSFTVDNVIGAMSSSGRTPAAAETCQDSATLARRPSDSPT